MPLITQKLLHLHRVDLYHSSLPLSSLPPFPLLLLLCAHPHRLAFK